MGERIESYKDLRVFQNAMDAAMRIFELTKDFPPEEKYSMVDQLHRNAEAVYNGIKDIPAIRLRRRPDPKGDIGYAVYFEMKSKTARDRCIAELRKRKVPASTLTGSVLLPVQESVINKRTCHRNWPSFNTPEGEKIKYGPQSCPQTLDIFDRFVQVRMGAKYTRRINDYIIDAIGQVYASLA